jgi:hypothetical protein
MHNSFQLATQAAGLLQDKYEACLALQDVISSLKSPGQLHFLFALLIIEGAPAIHLWDQFFDDLSSDYAHFQPRPIDDTLRHHAHCKALLNIDILLRDRGSSNSDCSLPSIPTLSVYIESELEYFALHAVALQAEVNIALANMSPDQ